MCTYDDQSSTPDTFNAVKRIFEDWQAREWTERETDTPPDMEMRALAILQQAVAFALESLPSGLAREARRREILSDPAVACLHGYALGLYRGATIFDASEEAA